MNPLRLGHGRKNFSLLCSLVLGIASSAWAGDPRLVVDQNYFPTLMTELERATESVDLLAFSFAIDDGKGKLAKATESYQVAEKLVSLRKKGVHIRLYIEGDRDTAVRNHITGDYLSSHGIKVVYGQTHAKGFLIDRKTVLMGSTNLTTQSMARNNETNLLLTEKTDAVEFGKFFDNLWGGGKTGSVSLQLPFIADGGYKNQILEMIRRAKSIDFSIYYFNDPEIEAVLIEAHRRKVPIRGYINQHKTFAPDLVVRNKATLARLRAAGLTSIFLDLDDTFSHSKYLIVDGKELLLGTGNWNSSDMKVHRQLYYHGQNEHLAKSLSRHLSSNLAYERAPEAPVRSFHRFWIGWKRPEISQAAFDTAIRDIFVPATVATIASRGGQAYIPVLPPNGGMTLSRKRGTVVIPDEFALVTYADEQKYRAIRESSVGAEYGPLHGDYFLMQEGNPQNSRSSVPTPWESKAEIGKSYDLSPIGTDWQKGKTQTILHLRKDALELGDADYQAGLTQYFDRVRTEMSGGKHIQGYVAYAGPEYIIEYVLLKDGVDDIQSLRLKTGFGIFEPTPFLSELAVANGAVSRVSGSAAISARFPVKEKVPLIMTESERATQQTLAEYEAAQKKVKERIRKVGGISPIGEEPSVQACRSLVK